MNEARTVGVVLPLLLLAGCGPVVPRARGGLTDMTPPASFPTPAELDQIGAAPVPARLFDDKAKDVPTWDLVGPLPDAMDTRPHEDSTTWGKLLVEVAASHAGGVTTTEAMHCVARENAAFYLDNEALPAEPLQRFIAARCGAPTSHFSTGFQGLKFDDRMSDDKIVAALREPTGKMLGSLLETGNQAAGIAFLRKKGKAVVSMAALQHRIRLDATPFTAAPDGKIVIRGEVLEPTASVRGLINRGRHGYARCVLDLRVALPRFALECPALHEDEAAWLEVAAFPPGRVLGTSILELLVWPAGTPGKTYAKLARSSGPPPTSPTPTGALVEGLNRVRKDAGLPLLILAERESATAARLAPHYFGAITGSQQGPIADQVALGLRAGWEVEGTVRNGTFVSTWVRDAKDPSDVLATALARPFGRESLLDPVAERVAIGTVVDPKEGVQAAVFSTYALFDGYRHDRDGAKVLARLTALRAARGLPPPIPMPELDAAATHAAQIAQVGIRSPGDALQELLDASAQRLGGNTIGGVSESSTLEDMRFPEQLLTLPGLRLAVGVAHRKPPGHPWARFIIFFVTQADSAPMTARRDGPLGG